MIRHVLLAVLCASSLSCASSGSGSTSDVQMLVFTPDYPPRCDFEEVGRMQADTPAWVTTEDRAAARQDYREAVKRMGGDAVIRADRPREYIVIRFTDPDCRE